MTYLEKQDHITSGLDYLITFWNNKPIATGITKAYLKEIQKLEDVLHDLLTQRGINVAIGAQLDVLGVFAGESRNNRPDSTYRLAILNRQAINNSDGTIPVVLDIIKSLSGTENPTLFEHYPALVITQVSQGFTNSLAKINDDIMAAGVCGLLSYNHNNEAFVGAELIETKALYITDNDELVELSDGSYLATDAYQHSWDEGTSFLPEIGEDINPLSELFGKTQYNVSSGLYVTDDGSFIELSDGSHLAWQEVTET